MDAVPMTYLGMVTIEWNKRRTRQSNTAPRSTGRFIAPGARKRALLRRQSMIANDSRDEVLIS